MKLIDNFLNSITMYRLVLYYLIFLVLLGLIFSFLKILSFNPLSLVLSTFLIIGVSVASNYIFSKTFNAPVNTESVYISALILALLINPPHSISDLIFLFWASLLTMALKYIFAINKKHIFNPVAIALVLTAIGFGGSASWWVGTSSLMPFVVVGGALIVRKIRREDLVFSFFITALLTIFILSIARGGNPVGEIQRTVFESSLFFLGFVMLTEPLTTPPTKNLQIVYAVIVGFLFSPQIHFGSFYTTPEIALCVGNIYSYLVSPKQKLLLKIKQQLRLAPDIISFIFTPHQRLSYLPGQYMEWTLPHKSPDNRGSRRYFTLASSPTETDIQLGIKFYPDGSSYKKALLNLDDHQPIVASQIAGDFTMPKNTQTKLAFIAGGIGITPFRSMIKYLLDIRQPRNITLLYSTTSHKSFVYHEIFSQAWKELGIKTFYTITKLENVPEQWQGRTGKIDENFIKEAIPDYKERIFYLSGTHAMVSSIDTVLQSIGVAKKQIKKDYFPGFV